MACLICASFGSAGRLVVLLELEVVRSGARVTVFVGSRTHCSVLELSKNLPDKIMPIQTRPSLQYSNIFPMFFSGSAMTGRHAQVFDSLSLQFTLFKAVSSKGLVTVLKTCEDSVFHDSGTATVQVGCQHFVNPEVVVSEEHAVTNLTTNKFSSVCRRRENESRHKC